MNSAREIRPSLSVSKKWKAIAALSAHCPGAPAVSGHAACQRNQGIPRVDSSANLDAKMSQASSALEYLDCMRSRQAATLSLATTLSKGSHPTGTSGHGTVPAYAYSRVTVPQPLSRLRSLSIRGDLTMPDILTRLSATSVEPSSSITMVDPFRSPSSAPCCEDVAVAFFVAPTSSTSMSMWDVAFRTKSFTPAPMCPTSLVLEGANSTWDTPVVALHLNVITARRK
mmetsp:Transcript_29668/g.77699  ORF Transcript_29668/g.77699 Transcript_29668/m.77699 type:complete len:227 (-) Transcript_29668:117-797(-)